MSVTTDAADGFEDVARILSAPGGKRIVITGNGASYYVGIALWLAALSGDKCPIEVVAVPGGLVAQGRFRWRRGDVLLAVSSSGEFRDVVEAIEGETLPRPFAAVTAVPDSTIGRAADALAVVHCLNQSAITHTQAFCGGVIAVLDLWARVTRDESLHAEVKSAPESCYNGLRQASDWAEGQSDTLATPEAMVVAGSGPVWAAALESALLFKEVAGIPCEGLETREAVTSGLTGMSSNHLALTLPCDQDVLLSEAESLWKDSNVPIIAAPGGVGRDPRLSAIMTFPSAIALAIEFAHRRGRNVDAPHWYASYRKTARRCQ